MPGTAVAPRNRPFVRLGRVTVDASTDPALTVQKIESALRDGAAKMGADAVVLIYDWTRTVGAVVTGGAFAGGERGSVNYVSNLKPALPVTQGGLFSIIANSTRSHPASALLPNASRSGTTPAANVNAAPKGP